MIMYAHNTKEALKLIEEESQRKDILISNLRERIKELEDESFKDKKLQEMKVRLEEMESDYYRGFPITEEEKNAISEWKKRHDEEVHGLKTNQDRMRAQGACGGKYKYVFIPTSIGVFGKVVCSCGAEFEFQRFG